MFLAVCFDDVLALVCDMISSANDQHRAIMICFSAGGELVVPVLVGVMVPAAEVLLERKRGERCRSGSGDLPTSTRTTPSPPRSVGCCCSCFVLVVVVFDINVDVGVVVVVDAVVVDIDVDVCLRLLLRRPPAPLFNNPTTSVVTLNWSRNCCAPSRAGCMRGQWRNDVHSATCSKVFSRAHLFLSRKGCMRGQSYGHMAK